MLITLNKEVKFKNKIPFSIEKTKTQEEKIKENWDQFIIGKTNYFNGKIYIVTDIIETKESYTLELASANFADLVFAKETHEMIVNSLFSSVLLKTQDNYYVFVKDRNYRMNLFGGMASSEDFINDSYNPTNCLIRELKEELGIDINDKNYVLNYYPAYLKIPVNTTESVYPTGIIYIANLKLTKQELERHFQVTKENLDHEIAELLFVTKDNYQELPNSNDSRSYIIEAIKLDIENN